MNRFYFHIMFEIHGIQQSNIINNHIFNHVHEESKEIRGLQGRGPGPNAITTQISGRTRKIHFIGLVPRLIPDLIIPGLGHGLKSSALQTSRKNFVQP